MTVELQQLQLENNLTMRPVTFDDLPAAVRLFNAVERKTTNRELTTAESLRHDWDQQGYDLKTAARAVFDAQGYMVGFVTIYDTSTVPVRPNLWLLVHPDYEQTNLGRELIRWGEQRARQVFERVPAEARVVLETNPLSTDHYHSALLKVHGYVDTGQAWCKMLIQMETAPQQPVWKDGIHVTTAEEVTDMRAIYRVIRTAFEDHRGHVDEDFEIAFTRWHTRKQNDPRFDPSLWFLAMAGDTIIGTSLCRDQSRDNPAHGVLNTLGVLREYRRKGVARALLLHTFNAFWQRDIKAVELWVDGSSLTGATHLYESAGMHVDEAYVTHAKELRPGKELSQQG